MCFKLKHMNPLSATRRFLPSIQQKIIAGFYSVLLIIVALPVLAFIEISFMENKFVAGEAISEFLNTTLELRRFEKNFFLSRLESDYRENHRYLLRASALFQKHLSDFAKVATEDELKLLQTDIILYGSLMATYQNQKHSSLEQRQALEKKIRGIGREMTTIAESIFYLERQRLRDMIIHSLSLLAASILILTLSGITLSNMVVRMVVKPLKQLELRMDLVADGRFEDFHIQSREREIVSLENAFKKMLHELESRQLRLVHSEKLASLGTLLSGVAHELNNPLANISTSIEIIKNEATHNLDLFHQELVTDIEEQVERAKTIVHSLLDYSREKNFKKEYFILMRLMKDTMSFIGGEIPTGISVELNIPEDATIYADRTRIQQAFLNLIKNAISAIQESTTDNESGTIRISARKGDANQSDISDYIFYNGSISNDRDYIEIIIQDTGKGIADENLKKIFDPFYTTREVGKGIGLGLFIVHEIVERHGGYVGVQSQQGKGSSFLIQLPMQEITA